MRPAAVSSAATSGQPGAVAARDQHRAAGAGRDHLCIGVGQGGWCHDEDVAKAIRQGFHQIDEGGAADQFLRIVGLPARAQQVQVIDARHAHQRFVMHVAVLQQIRQARERRHAEKLMLAWPAQVGVDQQRLLAEPRHHDRQVGGHHGGAIIGVRRDHRQRAAVVEPAQDELRAQRAQRLAWRGIGRVRREQFGVKVREQHRIGLGRPARRRRGGGRAQQWRHLIRAIRQ